jgi:hypothetical protein
MSSQDYENDAQNLADKVATKSMNLPGKPSSNLVMRLIRLNIS